MAGNFELAKQLGIFQGLKKRGDEAVQRALFIGQQAQDEMVTKRRDAEAKKNREEEQRVERKERREIELFKEATRQREKGEERLRQDTQRLSDQQRRDRERAEDAARHVREREEDIRRRAAERREDLETKGYEKQEKKAERAELREEKNQAFVTKKTADAQKVIEDEDKAVKAWMADRATGRIAAEDATEKAKERIRKETEKDLKEQSEARKPIFEEGEEILKAKDRKIKEEEKQEGELSKAKLASRKPEIESLEKEIERALKAGDTIGATEKRAQLFKIQKESRGLPFGQVPRAGYPGAENPRAAGGGEPLDLEGISPPRPTFGIFEGERVGTRTESIPQDMQLPREVEDFRRQKGGIGLFNDKKRGGAGGGAGPEAEPFRVLSGLEAITNPRRALESAGAEEKHKKEEQRQVEDIAAIKDRGERESFENDKAQLAAILQDAIGSDSLPTDEKFYDNEAFEFRKNPRGYIEGRLPQLKEYFTQQGPRGIEEDISVPMAAATAMTAGMAAGGMITPGIFAAPGASIPGAIGRDVAQNVAGEIGAGLGGAVGGSPGAIAGGLAGGSIAAGKVPAVRTEGFLDTEISRLNKKARDVRFSSVLPGGVPIPGKEMLDQAKNFITKVAANNPAHPADSAAEFLARNPTLDLKDLPEEAKFVLGLDLREVESLTPGIHALINPKYTEATKAFYNDVETLHPLWKAADLTPGKGADVAVGRYFITGSPGELASLTPPQVLAATKTKERIDQLIHEIYGPNADPGSYIVKHIVRGGQGISETFPEFAMRVSTKGSGAEMGEALLNTLNRKKYLGEALKEGRKMADALPTPGQKMYAHSYLDVMSGKPGGIEKKLPPGVGKFFHEMKINFARAVLGGRTSSAIMNGIMGTLMNVAGPDFVESSMRFLTRGPKTIMGKTFEEAGLTAAKMPPFLAKRPLREVMRKVDNVLYKMFDFTTMATAGVGYQQGVLAAEKAALKHGLIGQRAKKFMHDWGMKQARRVQNMGGAENASPVYNDPIVSAALQFTRPMAMTANQVLVEMPAQFAKGNPWPLLKWSAGAAAIIALGDQVGENYAPRIFDFMPWNWMKGPGRTSSYGFEKALTAMYNFIGGVLAGEDRSRKQRFEKSGWQAVAGNVPGGTLISDVKKNYFPSEKQQEETENLAYGQERPPLSGAEKFRRVFLGGTNEQSAERKLANIDVDDPDVRRDEINNAMEELEHYMRGGTKMGRLFDKLKKGKKTSSSTYLPPL